MKILFLSFIIILEISIIFTHKCGHDLIKKKSHKISLDRIDKKKKRIVYRLHSNKN